MTGMGRMPGFTWIVVLMSSTDCYQSKVEIGEGPMDTKKVFALTMSGPDSGAVDILTGFPNQFELHILTSLRQIIRAVELHSRKLEHDFQITGPQLSCLLAVRMHGPITVSRLAGKIFLSPGTVVGISDRLEEKNLIRRVRSRKDRRLVEISITERGEEMIGCTPPLMQEALSMALKKMPDTERVGISVALEKLVALMEAGDPSNGGFPPPERLR
jgi:DNA-binding MarR family transcriptional regulator